MWLLLLFLPLIPLLGVFHMTHFLCILYSLFDGASPDRTVVSLFLPGVDVKTALPHVSFGDIFVSQFGAPFWSGSLCQLAVEEVFGHASFVHTSNVAEPPESSLTQYPLHAGRTGSLQHLCVAHSVLPLDVQDAPQTPQVEGVKSSFLTCIRGPRFAAIKKRAQYTSLINAQSGLLCQAGVVPNSLV